MSEASVRNLGFLRRGTDALPQLDLVMRYSTFIFDSEFFIARQVGVVVSVLELYLICARIVQND